MQGYMKYESKNWVENFELSADWKSVSFTYFWNLMGITWKGGNNYETLWDSFEEIESNLLSCNQITQYKQVELGNDVFLVWDFVAQQLWLTKDRYELTIQWDATTKMHSWVFINVQWKESLTVNNWDDKTENSLWELLSAWGKLSSDIQSITTKIPDIYTRLYELSKTNSAK
jgi:hypothetical protein